MGVRIVIDISEDELAKIAENRLLSHAFANAVLDVSKERCAQLGDGATIFTATDIKSSGRIVDNHGTHIQNYEFSHGYGRYLEDQGSVAITGENGSAGQLPVREATALAPIK